MILSIETSTKVCSVALHHELTLLGSAELHVDQSHSEQLAILIQNILKTTGQKTTDLNAVAISAGPGSYTGLRIGTSTAKGLCYALEIPLIAINTLAAMAYAMSRFYTNSLICPMIDARRMEVYCQVFDAEMNEIEPTEAKVIDESSFSALLEDNSMVFFGNGAAKCEPVISHKNTHFVNDVYPSAIPLGELAGKKYTAREFEDMAYFEPYYLKEYKAVKSKKLLL